MTVLLFSALLQYLLVHALRKEQLDQLLGSISISFLEALASLQVLGVAQNTEGENVQNLFSLYIGQPHEGKSMHANGCEGKSLTPMALRCHREPQTSN